MNAIIFGNGLNVRFGGKDYLNGKIIRRGYNLLRQNHQVHTLVPPETVQFFDQMYYTVPAILDGLYDQAAGDCEEELIHFKKSYSNKLISDIGDIGLEDYFLILHLIYVYNRSRLRNTDDESWFAIEKEHESAECFRDLCLMGIYNNGRINQLYTRFSTKFIKFLNSFDKVFTTNYDENLDHVYNGIVQHIHGQFNVLDQIYDPSSLRNSLSDHPYQNQRLQNFPKYMYLHSTALMNYSGKNKFNHIIAQNNLARLTRDDILKVPNSKVDSNAKKLALEAAEIHLQNPKRSLQYSPAIDEYLNLNGNLSIIGLSAANDNHIFSDNRNVSYTYYYYSNQDLSLAHSVLPTNSTFLPVSKLWKVSTQPNDGFSPTI